MKRVRTKKGISLSVAMAMLFILVAMMVTVPAVAATEQVKVIHIYDGVSDPSAKEWVVERGKRVDLRDWYRATREGVDYDVVWVIVASASSADWPAVPDSDGPEPISEPEPTFVAMPAPAIPQESTSASEPNPDSNAGADARSESSSGSASADSVETTQISDPEIPLAGDDGELIDLNNPWYTFGAEDSYTVEIYYASIPYDAADETAADADVASEAPPMPIPEGEPDAEEALPELLQSDYGEVDAATEALPSQPEAEAPRDEADAPSFTDETPTDGPESEPDPEIVFNDDTAALYLDVMGVYTEGDLLEGVSAEDENGEQLQVSVEEKGGLDLENLALGAYEVTYMAEHPVTMMGFAATRMVYVAEVSTAVSNFEALKAAIAAAPSGVPTVITIANDIAFSQAITIGSGANIQFVGEEDKTCRFDATSSRHFIISSGDSVTLAFDQIVVDGGATGGGVQVNAGATATIIGAVIQNCKTSGSGGGIRSDGSLTVIGSAIKNNTASSGGGIYGASGAAILVTGGTISENGATSNGGGISGEAGVVIQVDGANISQNTTALGGAGIAGYSIEVTDSALIGNRAGPNGAGGGILGFDNAAISVTNTTISDNSGAAGGGIAGKTNSRITITDSTIEKNTATGTWDNGGGGIQAWNNSKLTLSNSVVKQNATHTGGGIWSSGTVIIKDGSKINNNTASGQGGGIWCAGSTVELLNGEISGNLSAGGGGVFANASSISIASEGKVSNNTSSSWGGGIYGYGDNGKPILIDLQGGQISGNTAPQNGGGIFIYAEGGSATQVKMNGGQISGNTAG